jgi:hypothetical protein
MASFVQNGNSMGGPSSPVIKRCGRVVAAASCGIRGNAATDSDGKRPPNPIESGHRFRGNAATLLKG